MVSSLLKDAKSVYEWDEPVSTKSLEEDLEF